MSVNIKQNGNLVPLATGYGEWTGTKAEYETQKDTIPVGTIVNITDDYSEGGGGSFATEYYQPTSYYNNFTNYFNDGVLPWSKNGKVVTIQLQFIESVTIKPTLGTWYNICDVPEGWRPSHNVYFALLSSLTSNFYLSTSTYRYFARVTTSGKVQIQLGADNLPNNYRLMGNVTYCVD